MSSCSRNPFIDSALARSRQLDSRLPLIVAERRSSIAEIVARRHSVRQARNLEIHADSGVFCRSVRGLRKSQRAAPGSRASVPHVRRCTADHVRGESEPSPAHRARGAHRVDTLRSPLNADVDLGRYPLAHAEHRAARRRDSSFASTPGVDAGALDLRFAGPAPVLPQRQPRTCRTRRRQPAAPHRTTQRRPADQFGGGRPHGAERVSAAHPHPAAGDGTLLVPRVGARRSTSNLRADRPLDGIDDAAQRHSRSPRSAITRATNIDLACARTTGATGSITRSVVEHIGVRHRQPPDRSRHRRRFSSELTFNGRIHIHPGAQRSDARLTNKNLLLDQKARINTKPELEIYANDVKCSHGATVGQIDPAQVFYLRTRGLDEVSRARDVDARIPRRTHDAVAARRGRARHLRGAVRMTLA